MSKKQKINTAQYNQITKFISDMPFDKAITAINASEKDMAHFRSTIIEQDDTETIIEISFTNMVTLTVQLQSWAAGSQTQVLILRKKSRKIVSYVLSKKKPEDEVVPGYIVLCVIIGFISLFATMWTGNLTYSLPIPVLVFIVIIVEGLKIQLSNGLEQPEKMRKVISNPYEESLVKYVEHKLDADEDGMIYDDMMQEYKKLKWG